MIKNLFVMCLLGWLGCLHAKQISATPKGMAKIGPGVLKLQYPTDSKTIAVDPFYLDKTPVTNAKFLDFVKKQPKWRRGKISSLFADSRYLQHWQSPTTLGDGAKPNQAVIYVSWFPAKAYCKSRDARLPTEDEWEFAGLASETKPDGSKDIAWKSKILAWYSKPTSNNMSEVGKGKPNYWKLFDMHGLVWEWVADFNNTMFSTDNRGEGDKDKANFCGSGSLNASDKENYASFMRFAFRSSLEAKYTTANLGFRCAKSIKNKRGE